ncbi:hypothetical protein LJR290_003209 [Variovorax sp. LjRoot290]|uniref:hypothetical protein n=1 Tax=Variovorax sp. LjRoot290 TaxID=3342316 RepID=UPI003ECCF7E3
MHIGAAGPNRLITGGREQRSLNVLHRHGDDVPNFCPLEDFGDESCDRSVTTSAAAPESANWYSTSRTV